MRDPMRTGEEVSWRDSVLRQVLTVVAALACPVTIIAVIGRGAGPWFDAALVLAVGISLPVLRVLPRLSIAARVAGSIAVLLGISVYLVGRNGFSPGVFLAISASSVLAGIYFGRRAGLAVIVLAGIAIVIIGALVTSGRLTLNTASLDPLEMRNWWRISFVMMLLCALLTLTVDVVIRHVESGARATQEALVQLATLHDKLEVAKEDERRFLARELHDELGQTLTALKFRIQMNGGPPSREALALVDDLIARVREMSVSLRPPLLDEVGLLPALRAYLESQSGATGVMMVLTAEPAPDDDGADRLSPDLEIACFRVVQESITNALRHAAANRIEVDVIRRPHAISLSIRDDGRGFDTAATLARAAADGHLGVVGMRERVRGRGGTFALHSRPGGGTRVTAELPLRLPL